METIIVSIGSALLGALVGAFVAWFTWLNSARKTMERALLSEALRIQALNEAWMRQSVPTREHGENDDEVPQENHARSEQWLRVEVRAVLDDHPWTTDEFYDFREGRRSWLVRREASEGECERTHASASGGQEMTTALVSSKGMEELCGWIEGVASAYSGSRFFSRMLSADGLSMIRPLLAPLAREDRARVLSHRLSKRANCFLADYRCKIRGIDRQ